MNSPMSQPRSILRRRTGQPAGEKDGVARLVNDQVDERMIGGEIHRWSGGRWGGAVRKGRCRRRGLRALFVDFHVSLMDDFRNIQIGLPIDPREIGFW